MNFPNLIWALSKFGPRYRFAASIGESESWLSRRLIGRSPFSAEERELIAKTLGYPATWLFAKPTPPRNKKATAQVST